MIQLIALIIFTISLGGILFILARKMPLLVQLPQNGNSGLKKPEFVVKVQKTIKAHHFHFFEKQMLLHTLLSKLRIWTLKVERKIDNLLHGIRKKAQELDKQAKKKK